MSPDWKKSRVLNEEERCRVAYRDGARAGGGYTTQVDLVQKVSIVPCRVGALGYTIRHPTEDGFLLGRTAAPQPFLTAPS